MIQRAIRPPIDRVLARVRYDHGCWEFMGARNKGYGVVNIGIYKKCRIRPVHRVAYEALVGPIPEGMVLDHLCRNRVCCNPLHLDPVTDRENRARGPIGGRVRITDDDVKEMRRMLADGMSQGAVANIFDIDQSHVSRIHNRIRRTRKRAQ